MSMRSRICEGALGDLSQIFGELLFFSAEAAILMRLNQPKVTKSQHKRTDPRPRRSHHLGQFFIRNLELDTNAARAVLDHGEAELAENIACSVDPLAKKRGEANRPAAPLLCYL
jgi:hypothetical protein